MKSDWDKNFYLFFLSKIKGLGNATVWQYLKSPDDSSHKVRQIIRAKQQDKGFVEQARQEFTGITEDYISILDDDYPALLKAIYDPPLFLFYRGNKKLLESRYLLTMVGSRIMTSYHQAVTKKIGQRLINTPLIIASGLAIGIDSASHQTALDNKLPTIAVLGSGLDSRVLYPQSNIKLAKQIINQGGLLLSEYPAMMRPQLHFFPKRNRILAGLSKATIVISGALKSGTLITAQVAIDEGREVMALPGNINSSLSQGPNSLIINGAHLLSSPQDILKLYNLNNKPVNSQLVFKNKLHAKIYTLLQTEPMNLVKLSDQLRLPLHQINSIISELEIKGLVRINKFNQVEII